jgi:hypothetical protein
MAVRPPRTLQAAGRQAWRAAQEQVDDFSACREVVEAYAHAVDRAHGLREAWRDAGSPAFGMGGTHGKVQVVHPLVAAIERSEEHVRRLARELEMTPSAVPAGAKRGRPPGRDPIEALGLGGLRVVR